MRLVSTLVQAPVGGAHRTIVKGVAFRWLKGSPQLKVPLSIASRRGDSSPVVRQFLKLAKQASKNSQARAKTQP
jgi:hypothetical protein